MLGEKRLSKKMVGGVDMIKLVLYEIFIDEFSEKYQDAGENFYGPLAGATINEIFGHHNKNSQAFFEGNEDLIVKEIIAFGIKHQELKRPVTDAIRVLSVARSILDKSIPIEHYAEVCNKAIDRGIFIKGGDKPNPKDFLQMAQRLARGNRAK